MGAHSMRWRGLAAAVLLLFVFGLCTTLWADETLPPDGDLIDGPGTNPNDWRRIAEAYLKPDQADLEFQWLHPQGAPGQLGLTTPKRKLIRWERTVALAPGLYHLTGEMHTEGLQPGLDYTNIGVETGKNTFGLSRLQQDQSAEWEKGELYFKVGQGGRRVDIACKLEGRGVVQFRRIILQKLETPAPGGATVVDLDQYPEEMHAQEPRPYETPIGRIWTFFLMILMLLAITISGWIALGPPHE